MSSDDPVVFNQSSQAICKFKLNFKNLHNSGYVRNVLIKRCIHSQIFCFCLFIHANLFDLHRDLRTKGEEKKHNKNNTIYYSSMNVLGQTIFDRIHMGFLEFRHLSKDLNEEKKTRKIGRLVDRKENNKDFFNGEPLNMISWFVCCLDFCLRYSYSKVKYKKKLFRWENTKKTSEARSGGRNFRKITTMVKCWHRWVERT